MAGNGRFDWNDLEAARAAGILDVETGERLRRFLASRIPAERAVPLAAPAPVGRFDITHVIWYAGSLIIMGAMGLFATQAFAAIGGYGLAFTGLLYMVVLGRIGDRLWQKSATQLPGGLLITAAVAMTPLIVFGFQEAWSLWDQQGNPGSYPGFFKKIRSGFVPMELITLLVAGLALRRYNFAFLALPAALCLWFLSMDLVPLLFGQEDSFARRRDITLWFGLITIATLVVYESRHRNHDAAFWLHLVAAITFWGGLTFRNSDSHLAKAAYCLINVGLIGFSVFIGRRVYAVLGVIGIMTYLGDLAWRVFENSVLFPYLLSMLGLALMALGLWIARRRAWIEATLEGLMPDALKGLRPAWLRAAKAEP
jgi:hypothetical protein